MQQMADQAKSHDIGALVHLEEGHDVTEVIGQSVERWSCNMMIMGWKADIERTAILAASNRSLTKNLDIDTLIFKERDFAPARRILVPTGGGASFHIGHTNCL